MQINTPVFASTSQMPVSSHLFLNPLHLGRCSLCIRDALNNSDVLRTVEHRGLDGPPHQLKIKSSELYKSVTPFEAKKPPWGLEWALAEHTAASCGPGLNLIALWKSEALLISAETIFNNVWSKRDSGWRNTAHTSAERPCGGLCCDLLYPVSPICPSQGHGSFQGMSYTAKKHFKDDMLSDSLANHRCHWTRRPLPQRTLKPGSLP